MTDQAVTIAFLSVIGLLLLAYLVIWVAESGESLTWAESIPSKLVEEELAVVQLREWLAEDDESHGVTAGHWANEDFPWQR